MQPGDQGVRLQLSTSGTQHEPEPHRCERRKLGEAGEGASVVDVDPRDEGAGYQTKTARGLHYGLHAVFVLPLLQHRQDGTMHIRSEALPAPAVVDHDTIAQCIG